MATVWPALGTTLSICKSSGTTSQIPNYTPGTWTPIAQLMSITCEPSVGSAEITNLASTWKQYRPTLPDGGEISCECEYDPTDTGGSGSASGTHVFLKSIQSAWPQLQYMWQISYPTVPVATDTFLGFLTKGPGRDAGGPEENLKGSLTIKVNGAIQ